jgi:hypothetical protein
MRVARLHDAAGTVRLNPALAYAIAPSAFLLAPQEHPDKGGDPEKFKEIARAYEVRAPPPPQLREPS